MGGKYVRRGLLPLLDRFLRRLDGGHYASYELDEGEIVGLIDAPPEQVERMLWEAGATRMPLAALKRLAGGGALRPRGPVDLAGRPVVAA